MMGFGAIGMTSWIFGAIPVATIGGGARGWLLATIRYHPKAEVPPKKLATTPGRSGYE